MRDVDELGQVDLNEVTIVLRIFQACCDIRPEFGSHARDPAHVRRHAFEQFGGAVLQRSQVDVPLGFEIQVQCPLGQTRGSCDLVHGGVSEPFLRKDFAGSIQNLGASKLGNDLLLGSSSRGAHETDWTVSLVYYEIGRMIYSLVARANLTC